MSDRLKGCTVTFDADYRDDDAETILAAIRMIRGVASVGPVKADHTDWMARQRVQFEAYEKAVKALHEVFVEKG